MGRVVVVNFTSIDGVVQSPVAPDEDPSGGFAHGGWVVPYSDEVVGEVMRTATVSAAGMLLGRRSYEILTRAWSSADETEPAVAAMNRMPKHVVSRSPVTPVWAHTEQVEGGIPDGVRDLVRRTDGDLVVFGSGVLVTELAAHDLVDSYRLLVFPLVLGAGRRMFDDSGALAHFTLTDSVISPSGVAVLTWTRSSGAAG